jgi:predicted nucleic acid-binding protein
MISQSESAFFSRTMAALISNTSPLIAFSAIDRLDLLRGLFNEVLIPPAVRHELFPAREWANAKAAQQVISARTWILVEQPPNCLKSELRRLGNGEAEAIGMALEKKLPVLLDDLRARKIAHSLGLEVVGSLGVLARNKGTKCIPAVKPIVEAIQRAGIYYDDELIHQFLRELGEPS